MSHLQKWSQKVNNRIDSAVDFLIEENLIAETVIALFFYAVVIFIMFS
jgi:hypothetical protein